MCIGPCIVLITEEKELTRSYLLFYYTYDRLNVACSPDTYPACLHLTSNQQQPKNGKANVVIRTIVVSS